MAQVVENNVEWDSAEFEKTLFELKNEAKQTEPALPDPGTLLTNGMYMDRVSNYFSL